MAKRLETVFANLVRLYERQQRRRTHRLNMRLSQTEFDLIRDFAERRDCSISDAVRCGIVLALEAEIDPEAEDRSPSPDPQPEAPVPQLTTRKMGKIVREEHN